MNPRLYALFVIATPPEDYVRLRVDVSVLATEVSDASGTLLLDVARRRWSDEATGWAGA